MTSNLGNGAAEHTEDDPENTEQWVLPPPLQTQNVLFSNMLSLPSVVRVGF